MPIAIVLVLDFSKEDEDELKPATLTK